MDVTDPKNRTVIAQVMGKADAQRSGRLPLTTPEQHEQALVEAWGYGLASGHIRPR